VLAFTEAATNMLKHAGGGRYTVARDGHLVRIVLADAGGGIDFKHLPRAALIPGFSTHQTLGMGFTLMLALTDRLLLTTDANGTTVILEKG
jgi:anti-sigma regulatory factor (Ser/Thr protein kinase)